jgi:hypothetical protein
MKGWTFSKPSCSRARISGSGNAAFAVDFPRGGGIGLVDPVLNSRRNQRPGRRCHTSAERPDVMLAEHARTFPVSRVRVRRDLPYRDQVGRLDKPHAQLIVLIKPAFDSGRGSSRAPCPPRARSDGRPGRLTVTRGHPQPARNLCWRAGRRTAWPPLAGKPADQPIGVSAATGPTEAGLSSWAVFGARARR